MTGAASRPEAASGWRGRTRGTLGPLAPVLAVSLSALVLLSASRLALVALHWPRVRPIDGFWRVFPIGLRLDVMTLSWLVFPATACLLVCPRRLDRLVAPAVAGYLAAVVAVLAFLETATYPFVAQYDSRPNRVFIEYVTYPHEVAPTLWADHKIALGVGVVVVAVAARAAWRATLRLLGPSQAWSWRRRLAVAPIALVALLLGARSTLGPRGGNISTASFSADHLLNELALDSTYAVGYALDSQLHDEVDVEKVYGALPRGEAIARVRAQTAVAPAAFTSDDLPLLHRQASATPRARPYNLVVLLEESLGAEYVGVLGGLPLTPSFDALAAEGLLFTNLYATGTRTVRGIEAVVCGFLPTPGASVVKLGLAQGGFFTLAELLARRGYATDFIYGGGSNFDNMRGFFLNDGFQRVIDEPAFEAPVFHGTWGVSDEDLVWRANDTFVAHGDRPFFALVLSTSNHPPFEYPAGRIALFEQPANTVRNAMKYADWAIGEFFRLAKREAYWRDTIFLVVADHNTRVWGLDLVPLDRFHVPALVLGAGVAPGRHEGLASQVDLAPTVLDLMGLDVESPLMGRDLVATPGGRPGHAFMQYDLANAYRVGEHVVVHQPYKAPRQFAYEGGRLRAEPLDAELARDALAHVQVPAMLYAERRYRMPDRVRR
jgi:phosphoglycerol transferase MdoB-like AlkP superfamily enzyme